ncbi:MAG TPA: hypothetical protein VGK20_18275 [Candidatus Binatia bacterium]|jgi:hypothetical protein
MHKVTIVALGALFIVGACAGGAAAGDKHITTKKILIKDNTDPAKRQLFGQSGDSLVLYSDAHAPGLNGATVHVWSATDSFCQLFESGPNWQDTGKAWKYKNSDTKNQFTIQDKKLSFKIKSGVTYSLLDNTTQGTVHASVKTGGGTVEYCMTCIGANGKDTASQFNVTNCGIGSCAGEPAGCHPEATTTSSTTTTTTTVPSATVVGALLKSTGVFTYNMTLGLPGAQAACLSAFGGSAHACTYLELQGAEGNGSMMGLKDPSMNPVTDLWAIDPTRTDLEQCRDISTPTLHWHYGTFHTGAGGDSVLLNNATGQLGTYTPGDLPGGSGCNAAHWVACCQ